MFYKWIWDSEILFLLLIWKDDGDRSSNVERIRDDEKENILGDYFGDSDEGDGFI